MTHTLLIYEMVPETVTLYLIPNNEINEETRDFLRAAQGKLINADEMNDGMEFLNAAVQEPEYKDDVEPAWKQFACVFHQYKVEDEGHLEVSGKPITHVYTSGFVL